ncbi:MAG: SGNH/GDSL hydrolase family protein, partial [Segatella copri]
MTKQTIKILLLALLLAGSSSLAFAQKVWKGSWATAVEWTGKGDMPKESLSNRSCRQIVHVSFGGEELRVKLSNEQSKEPVEIKSVYIADTDVPSNWGILTKTVKYLKFNGKKNVTIAPGKAIFSDDLKYALKSGQRLTITIDYGKQTPVNATSHRGSRT